MSHVVVLTAAPEAGLSDGRIARIRAEIPGAGLPRRLSGSAAEIPVPVAVETAIPEPDIDVNCVPMANRRKKLLIADMDSTIIPVECIDEVADFAGVRTQVVAITEPAMRGEISFEEALRARVALLKGLPEAQLAEVYAERVRLNPGAATLVRTMRANGAYAALVSGGFSYFTERVAAAARFDEHRANRLIVEDGRLSGAVEEPILGREAKLDALRELLATHEIGAAEAMAVGDGANDLAMIEAAGMGVAFRAKPVVSAAADSSVRHGTLAALLYLQGYAEAEFVRE